MADNELFSGFGEGDDVLASHIKQLITALNGSFFLRRNNIVQGGLNLGSSLFPVGTAFIDNLVSRGGLVDFSSVRVESNRIVSGKRLANSSRADFINLTGGLNFTIDTSTPLNLVIDGRSVSYESNINLSATAGITGNRTADANIGELGRRALLDIGETDFVYGNGRSGVIPIDGLGASSVIEDRVGQFSAFQYDGSGYLFAYIKSETELSQVRNYIFRNASGPIQVRTKGTATTFTILKTGWVFLDSDNQVRPEITYRYPESGASAPSNPEVGNYWFDSRNSKWKRYDGGQFVEVSKMPVAIIAVSGNNITGYHCFDFSKNHSKENNLELEIVDDRLVGIKRPGVIEVDSQTHFVEKLEWNLGQSAVGSTRYYLYLRPNLRTEESTTRPYYDPRRGYYHPYENWRCLGSVYTESNGDLDEDSGHNAYIYHKYNPNADIDLEYSIYTNQNGGINYVNSTIRSSSGWTYIRHSQGVYRLTPPSGLFSNSYLSIATATGDEISVAYSTEGGYPADGDDLTGFATRIGSSGSRHDEPLAIKVSRVGNDHLQTVLDNTLK